MPDEAPIDLRLDPNARVEWSIPKQEWDAYVRNARKVFEPSFALFGGLATLVLTFVALFGLQVWSLLKVPAGTSTGVAWWVVVIGMALYFYFTREMWTGATAPLRRILSYRRRGHLVWERSGCVCPTCLAPFADDGRATCAHRFAACQQPPIVRLFEAEATEDLVRAEELELALGAERERLGLDARTPTLRKLRLESRLDPQSPTAWPFLLRLVVRSVLLAITFALFWIAAGWNAVVWFPALMLVGYGFTIGRRSKRRVRSRPICTKCGHTIHDLSRTPRCTECGSDLSRVGSIRSSEEKIDGALKLTSWMFFGAAAVWMFLCSNFALQALPTSALITAVRFSTASTRAFTNELNQRTLSNAESAAATDAYLRWSLRNPHTMYGTLAPAFVRSTNSLTTLSPDLITKLADEFCTPTWQILEGEKSTSIAESSTIRITKDAPTLARCSAEMAAQDVLMIVPVARPTAVEVVRSGHGAIMPVEWIRSESTAVRGMPPSDPTRVLIPLGSLAKVPLAPGTYDITVKYSVKFVPNLSTLATRVSGTPSIDDVAKDYPATMRSSTIRVIVE